MGKYDDTDWTAAQKVEARQRDREIAAEHARMAERAAKAQQDSAKK